MENIFNKLIEMVINGTSYEVSGNNVSVVNDKVYVNGKLVVEGLSNTVHIEWKGPAANIDCTSITVHGDVSGDIDATNVKCGNVNGNVDATSVNCGDVGGDVDSVSMSMKRKK